MSRRLEIVAPFALWALALATLAAVSGRFLSPALYDFGQSLHLPTPGYSRYLGAWMLLGSLATAALAVGLARASAASGWGARLAAAWRESPDRKWIVYGSVFAALIPAALRTFLLEGMPLTDDEAAYRLMARALAQGRLWADSPPLKLFFDNRFLINDGKLYAHYFIGWPALQAPGVWLGIPGFMNALYSGLTLPALFLVLRRLAGGGAARFGVLLYLASPMLMTAAATETSHTSCVAALAWLTWFALASRDPGARWWHHAGVATLFSVAFFVRPPSALGVGLPLLLWWAWGALGRRGGERLRAVVAFALPAVVLAGLFLAVNRAQTGSAFEVAYQRAYTYAQENDFRFSLWPAEVEGGTFTELRFGDPARSLAVAGAALWRLNVTLMGWPSSLLFAFFAGRGRRLLWASVASYFIVHFATDNVGIDTFAPMHYFEVAWPLLLLSASGLARLSEHGARLDSTPRADALRWRPLDSLRYGELPAALLAALVVTGLLSYVPVRFTAIHRVVENVAMPHRALAEAGIERAVVFAPDPFVYYCRHPPTRGWVFARPNNGPRLDDDVLWVNHLSLEKDELLMRRFPDRQGYVMMWDTACRVVFLPLGRIPPGLVPDAAISGLDEVGAP